MITKDSMEDPVAGSLRGLRILWRGVHRKRPSGVVHTLVTPSLGLWRLIWEYFILGLAQDPLCRFLSQAVKMVRSAV